MRKLGLPHKTPVRIKLRFHEFKTHNTDVFACLPTSGTHDLILALASFICRFRQSSAIEFFTWPPLKRVLMMPWFHAASDSHAPLNPQIP